MGSEKQGYYEVERKHTGRKHDTKRESRESREQIRKGVGACIFLLGIPLVIAGLILTVVAYTKDDTSSLPTSLPVLGPLLVVLAVLCFITGSIMTDIIKVADCCQFCIMKQSENLCWKKCPKLFSLLYPDEVMRIQQRNAGLSALKTVPQKPALKRPTSHQPDDAKKKVPKYGVHFTPNDICDERKMSTSSDPCDLPTLSDTEASQRGSLSSLLSLRHFRIGPTEGSAWVEMRHAAPVFEHVSFEYVTEFGNPDNGHPTYNQSQVDATATNQSTAKYCDSHTGGIKEQKF